MKFRFSIFKNTSGFTLIEIIASIAILAMVIAVFLPIFPQILQWTNNVDDDLVASNLLGKIAYDIKLDFKNDPFKYTDQTIHKCNSGELLTSEYKENEYNVKLYMCQEDNVDLYRTHIEIYSSNNKLLSESYTYVGEKNG